MCLLFFVFIIRVQIIFYQTTEFIARYLLYFYISIKSISVLLKIVVNHIDMFNEWVSIKGVVSRHLLSVLDIYPSRQLGE